MNRVGNGEVRRRAIMERELASRSENDEMVWTCGENG